MKNTYSDLMLGLLHTALLGVLGIGIYDINARSIKQQAAIATLAEVTKVTHTEQSRLFSNIDINFIALGIFIIIAAGGIIYFASTSGQVEYVTKRLTEFIDESVRNVNTTNVDLAVQQNLDLVTGINKMLDSNTVIISKLDGLIAELALKDPTALAKLAENSNNIVDFISRSY